MTSKPHVDKALGVTWRPLFLLTMLCTGCVVNKTRRTISPTPANDAQRFLSRLFEEEDMAALSKAVRHGRYVAVSYEKRYWWSPLEWLPRFEPLKPVLLAHVPGLSSESRGGKLVLATFNGSPSVTSMGPGETSWREAVWLTEGKVLYYDGSLFPTDHGAAVAIGRWEDVVVCYYAKRGLSITRYGGVDLTFAGYKEVRRGSIAAFKVGREIPGGRREMRKAWRRLVRAADFDP